MKQSNVPVTEDELHAFVDGELPEDRREDVETWLETHSDDAARVGAWRTMAGRLHRQFDRVADETVPDRLRLERIDRQLRRRPFGAIAAGLVAAFVTGSAAGWLVRDATATPPALASFTDDALQAHRLYAVEVRHPVEVGGSERDHLQQWLSKRVGYSICPPDLEKAGLKLIGGRLLPGPGGPAAFFMYEGPSGERFTVYSSRATPANTQMHYIAKRNDASMYWSDSGVGYALSGPADRPRLQQLASAVYDEVEKAK